MDKQNFKAKFFAESLSDHLESTIYVFLGVIGCLSETDSKVFLKMFGDWNEASRGEDDGKEAKIRMCILDFLTAKQSELVLKLFAADEK